MNKTLIAAAVSAALMAPVAAQADVTVYGRIHQGIKIVNPEMGDSMSDFIGVGSRFGIKASSDLGNGMTASAQYEFGTTSDRNNHGSNAVTDAADDSLWSADSSGITNRIATVGISGAFGSIDLGNQWGAYYNIAGVHMDPTFNIGSSIYYGIVDTNTYRTANTIKYSNSFGPVSLQLDVRLDDTDKKGKANPARPCWKIQQSRMGLVIKVVMGTLSAPVLHLLTISPLRLQLTITKGAPRPVQPFRFRWATTGLPSLAKRKIMMIVMLIPVQLTYG